jgi:hypothetical protein
VSPPTVADGCSGVVLGDVTCSHGGRGLVST